MALELNIGEGVVFQLADKGEKSRADTSGRGTRISHGEGSEELQALGNSNEPPGVSEQENDDQI